MKIVTPAGSNCGKQSVVKRFVSIRFAILPHDKQKSWLLVLHVRLGFINLDT